MNRDSNKKEKGKNYFREDHTKYDIRKDNEVH